MNLRTTTLTAAFTISLVSAAHSVCASDFQFRGLLDLVAAERGAAYGLNTLIRGDSPFDAYGLRLFADVRANDRLQVFSQIVLRDAATPYVDGAYLMYTPMPARDLHVLAGKVPWPIGTFATRTYSNRNPLIGAPLMYQYHSTLVWYAIPPNADALLATSGSGQFGVDYHGYTMGCGMTLVDDSYWDVGVTLTGSTRPLEYALGLTAGTPGWGSTSQDENTGKSLLGRVGFVPLPGVRLGVSAAYGPYLIEPLNPALPAGKNVNDYHQRLGMADLELSAGHFEVHAEGARNQWETPTVGTLGVTSGYAEVKYSLSFGAFLAGRWDTMRFDEITDSTGAARPWDSNVTRVEAGVGYRLSREAVGKVVYQRTRVETEGPSPVSRTPSMFAAQLSVGF